MNKEIITLGKIEKRKFHYHKNPVLMDDVDIDKILISDKVFVGTNCFSCFIGQRDDEKVKSLCIMLLKMSCCTRSFYETKFMSFFNRR